MAVMALFPGKHVQQHARMTCNEVLMVQCGFICSVQLSGVPVLCMCWCGWGRACSVTTWWSLYRHTPNSVVSRRPSSSRVGYAAPVGSPS